MILRALWLRPMLASPGRTAATVLGVAIGVASVVSTVLASRAAVASLGDDVEVVAGGARLEVTRPGGVRTEDLALLSPLAGELLAIPIVEGVALVPRTNERVRILGVDLLVDAAARDVELDTGERSFEDARHEMLLGSGVALSEALAERLGVRPGEPLELVARSVRRGLEVAAVFRPPELASAWDRIVLCDVALAQELVGEAGWIDRIDLVPREGAPADLDTAALAARATALLPETYTVAPASLRRDEGLRLVGALEFNLAALSGVSVLVGIVLVATSLATSIVQRRGQIAILRSLGAGRGQLAAAVALESAAIGLAGGGLGVLLGLYGARAALGSVRATMTTVAAESFAGEVRFAPVWIAVGLAIGVGAALAAALIPLREAVRTPPVQGLAAAPEEAGGISWRGRALAIAALLALAAALATLPPVGVRPAGGRPVWALVAALVLLAALLVAATPLVDAVTRLRPSRSPVSLRLAQASMGAGRARAAWAAGAIGVAVGLAVAMTTMVGSFRTTVVEWTEQTLRADLYVQPIESAEGLSAGGVSGEAVEIARRLFGRLNVDVFHQTGSRVAGERVLLAGAPLEVGALHGGVAFLDGRDARDVFREARERGEVLVNEPFARRFDVGTGDEIALETPAGVLRRGIAGVYRDYSGHTGRVVMDLPAFLAAHPDEGTQGFSVFLPPGRHAEEARAELAGALEGRFALEVLNQRELRAEVLAVFERTFAVTVALQVVASVVAAIAVVAVLTALAHERRQELAIVRVLGGSRAQLAGMVLGEAGLLGAAGTLGGLAVGLAVGYVLVAVVNPQSFGWTLRFAPPWGSVLWTLAAVLPACLLAGLAPASVVLRSAPHEALATS